MKPTALTEHIQWLGLPDGEDLTEKCLEYKAGYMMALEDAKRNAQSLLAKERDDMEDMFKESESYSEHEEAPDASSYFDTHYTQNQQEVEDGQ